MEQQELIPHLFRTEYRKIVSVLSKRFGFDQIEIAEDIASDTFLTASQSWPFHGIPPNPAAWLHQVAKNKAKNHLQRNSVFFDKIIPELRQGPIFHEPEIDLSPQNIKDSQLQMMFAICDPAISSESQIGLSLRILCGFGIEEIADAFLTNKETINKRLVRAREKLRAKKISIEIPQDSQMEKRLETVLTTIYLLFNEGYYSWSQNEILRKDFCLEAMRLCTMLVENKSTNKPKVNALLSLMCFHASRFNARSDKNGAPVLYDDQDESLWSPELISRGAYFLHCASIGNELSNYHLEAGIAFWSTQKQDSHEKWNKVLQLYDRLLETEYSPVAALNRIYALSKIKGEEIAVREAENLNLSGNPLYYLLLGQLYTSINHDEARLNYLRAIDMAKTSSVKSVIQRKLDGI